MKNNNRKRVWIIPICIAAVLAYFIWVSFLNLNYGKTEIINCHIGENISENAYQYKATEYNILTEKEFEKKYGVEIDDEQFKMYADVKILTVNMEITKINTNDSKMYKFDLSNLYAQTLTYSQGISYNLFSLINCETIELININDKARVTIPYVFVKDVFSDESWNNFGYLPLKISFSNAENSKKEIILSE
ncbi:hypothetical protein [Ruminococcus sp. YE282]|uniref:hypothetical protein n=1 Tax=Ruminococcus sp. YE282 TaxID=3158780 RepID=UPI0008855D51|nr:hypothetical protein [Ruminococcus bromii]SCY70757.1 hypothetical protein SAMN02910441_02130 [Ruminococcus bromii]